MKTVAVSQFRANLVGFLKKVEQGEVISLTSRGKEVAKIVPPGHKSQNAEKALETLRKTAIVGDILSAIEGEW